MDKPRFFVFDTYDDYLQKDGIFNFLCTNPKNGLRALVIRFPSALPEFLKSEDDSLLILELGLDYVEKVQYFLDCCKKTHITSWYIRGGCSECVIDGMHGPNKLAYDVLVENLLPSNCKEK